MEIKQLQYFLAAAEHLSFTEAAQACFIVQSAMSQQIAALEKELDVQLFVREKRALKLTAEGEALYNEAKSILNQVAYSKAVVQEISKGYRSILRLGRYGDLMRDQLPKVLHRFRQDNPDVKLLMVYGEHQALLNALANQEIDCMLSLFWPEYRLYNWLDFRCIARQKVMVMLPRCHPLAKRQAVSMAELAQDHMILLGGSDKKARLAEWAASGGMARVYHYADSQNSIEALVAAGYGVAPCVESACRPHPDIVYVDLLESTQEQICVVWNKSHVSALLEHKLLPLFLMPPSDFLI